MKKLLVIVLLALLVASFVLVAGCGSSGDDGDKKDDSALTGPVMDADEGGGEEYSFAGTYESAEGKTIEISADGTFETDAWEGQTGGTYMVTQDEEGYYWVDLNFKDGTLVVMSVMIGMDEVAALVDDLNLVQYTKK